MGQGFAGVAAGVGGLSSMFWNPATITQTPGLQSSWSFTGIVASSKTTPVVGTSPLFLPLGGSGDIGQPAILPATYTSYQVNDSLWLGLATNSPFGLVTKNNPRWAGGFYGQTSKVFSTDITPTIGYKINDWISVGAGVQVEYFKVRLTSLRPPTGPSTVELKGDSWGLGYTLGATFKPLAGTEIGIGYRSRVKQKLEGTLGNFPTLPALLDIKSSLTLPDEVTIGISQKITDQFTLSGGFEWTNWSLFNSFPVVITGPVAIGAVPTNLAFRYRNGWYASVGGAYQWSPALTLKAGLGYERSPINDTNRGVRLPDNNRIWTTIGASYKYNNKLSLDFSYAHAFFDKSRINISGPANPAWNPAVPLAFVGSNRTSFNIVSLGLNYRWDDPKVAIAVPLVRKY
jgi:long-chain fatty acid transport protein